MHRDHVAFRSYPSLRSTACPGGCSGPAIAYGSLYPFVFHHAGPLSADLANFLASVDRPPQGRGDVLANVLLYIPLGLAATLAFTQDMRRVLAAGLTFLAVRVILFVELAQFYDADRFSAFSDFSLNVAGTCGRHPIALD